MCWRRKSTAHSHLDVRVSRKAYLICKRKIPGKKECKGLGDARESIRKKGVNAVILKGEGTGSLGLRGTRRFKTGEIQFIKACVGHTVS